MCIRRWYSSGVDRIDVITCQTCLCDKESGRRKEIVLGQRLYANLSTRAQ